MINMYFCKKNMKNTCSLIISIFILFFLNSCGVNKDACEGVGQTEKVNSNI